MRLFLLLLIPFALAIWLKSGEEPVYVGVFNAFLGLVLASVFCAYKYFFSPYYFITPDSFWRNFLHVFVEQTLLPLSVLTCAFLLLYKKDKIADRMAAIFPFYAGFYAVYLPFRTINAPLPHTGFGLFAKPILFLLMLLVVAKSERLLFVPSKRALLSAKDAAFAWLSFAMSLFLPSAFESLWILGMGTPVTVIFVLLYSALCAWRLFLPSKE